VQSFDESGTTVKAAKWSPTLREIAIELLEYQRVEYLDEDRLAFVPPDDFSHCVIASSLVRTIVRSQRDSSARDWECSSGNFLWDFGDGTGRFAIPDLAVAHAGARNSAQYRMNIALLAEITSAKNPGATRNDRIWKPKWYAEGGVPLYLLVDQEQGSWTLHQLIEDWPKYQIASSGKYGEPIELPAPFGFAIPTDKWPAYSEDGE
jgi:Putative restriction endonuclease